MSRWTEIARDGGFTDTLLFQSLTLPYVFFSFEFSHSYVSFLFPSFYPLTTWAATLRYCHMSGCQPPHHCSLWLARPFQVGELLPDNNLVWLLEQRCNWLICSPCLGLRFWSSPVCVGVYWSGGLFDCWTELQISIHARMYTHTLTHYEDCTNTHSQFTFSVIVEYNM